MKKAKSQEQIDLLRAIINNIRDLRSCTIKADDLNEEQLFFLQEGYREGLCSAAMTVADELDAIVQSEPDCPEEYKDGLLMDIEENWWHTHNDEEGDIGSPDRL